MRRLAAWVLLFVMHVWPSVAGPIDATSPNIEQGERLFERNCIVCHGVGGTGGRGPGLNRANLARASNDAALAALIVGGIPPEMPDGGFFTDDDVLALVAYVRSLGRVSPQLVPGSIENGCKVYQRSGCASCHIISGTGIGYGPELTDLGERRSVDYVRSVILTPPDSLPTDFLLVDVTTAFGELIQGIRVNEDTYSIQIKDANANYFSFRKSDLRELNKRYGQTPMPSFATRLTSIELRDLVAYLVAARDGQ